LRGNGQSSRFDLASFHLLGDDTAAARKEPELCSETVSYRLPLLEGIRAKWQFAYRWKVARQYDEDLLETARSTFTKHGYHGELVDLLLLECEVTVEDSRHERAKKCFDELHDLTSGHENPDVQNEAAYLLARLHMRTDDPQRASVLLSSTRRQARDRHKPGWRDSV